MDAKDEQTIVFLCGEVSALGQADTLLYIEANNRAKDPRRAPLLQVAAKIVEGETEKRLKEIWEILNKYYGGGLPSSIVEALNSGDGSYRP
jgi:hypothetical protein